jgi:uracil-DNA glycosylase
MQAMKPRAILALGRIAHDAVLHASDLKPRDHVFAHGAIHELPRGVRLYDSYHCSRYNTQTRRLTAAMFEDVLGRIASDLRQSPRA